jgi:fructosamine-3-kinase
VRIPDAIREPVTGALAEHGLGSRIVSARHVGGGCISHGARIETDTATQLFVKWNEEAPPGLFDAEADGLRALAGVGALRVPTPLAWDEPSDGVGLSWLLLEYVAPGRVSRSVEEALGRGLARLHSAPQPAPFGWRRNNWIGLLPQDNAPTASWGDFWRDQRVVPQLEAARLRGHFTKGDAAAVLDRLVATLPGALAHVRHPELVHGDLWGGNWYTSVTDEPVLIDPAVYLGHGEVDLAMSELFGGFGSSFYAAYRETHGLSAEYETYGRDLYQLYYLLVHVNLFGASYANGALRAARKVCASVGA